MAKKNNNKTIEETERKLQQGYKYLDRVDDDALNNPKYIPEHIQQALNPWVRNKRSDFDVLTEIMETSDKNSEEYSAAAREREKIANGLITAKDQIEGLKKYTKELKNVMTNMNPGTKEENLFSNILVGGAQADSVAFDNDGKLNFGNAFGDGKNDFDVIKLDDVVSTQTGLAPIITDPIVSKTYVWKMAERVKTDANSGKPFDEDWTYTMMYNNLAEGGPQNTIAVAFADLAGDNRSKSFAEMYEAGFKDSSYYTDPETGQQLPKDSSWMKDPSNANVLNPLLSK